MVAKAALRVISTKAPVLGDLINRLDEIRQERKPLDKKSNELKADYDEIVVQVMALLDASGTLKGSSAKATVSISEVDVPIFLKIDESDSNSRVQFFKWAVRTGNLHMMTPSCISAPAFREVLQLKGGCPPGIAVFTKRGLNHTSLKG